MAQFIAIMSHQGAFPADFADQPAPDPAMFGMPTEDDGSRTDALLGAEHHRHAPTTSPISTRCGRASTRIVIGRRGRIGGRDGVPRRGGRGRAARDEPVIFPSDHGGFLGGEYGQTGEPDAFAAKLREVLAST